MTLDVLELAARLVQIPSVNPGSTATPENHPGEGAMGAAVQDILIGLGATVSVTHPLPGRPNVTGFFDFGRPDTVIMEAHLDTVPVDGMTIDPFGGVIHDGKLWGRGACDVKGPMAAMLAAISRVVEEKSATRNILFAAVCDEESGFSGVRHFLDTLNCGQRNKITTAIVAEPTLLHPVIAHKGVIRWTISTAGVAAHSSTPHLGRNAIYEMARVISRLEEHAAQLETLPAHDNLGTPTLSVGTITGGSAVNIVPETCAIQVDRRLIPGELPATATREVTDLLAGLNVTISEPIVQAPAMETSPHTPFAQALLSAAKAAGADPKFQYANYCTDASFYSFNEIEAIVFGPGSIEHAHTKDEFITLQQVQMGTQAYETYLK